MSDYDPLWFILGQIFTTLGGGLLGAVLGITLVRTRDELVLVDTFLAVLLGIVLVVIGAVLLLIEKDMILKCA